MPQPKSIYAERRSVLAHRLADAKLDALIVSFLPNVRYLTGFTGSNGVLLLSPNAAILLTDPRYDIQARAETDCRVMVLKKSTWRLLPGILSKRHWRTIGFESSRITVDVYNTLQAGLPLGTRLQPVSGWVEDARIIKSAEEIEAIRTSVRTCSAAFAAVVKGLRTGQTEFEVAAELDYQMRRRGAESSAFETIVASGPRSALPHARPSSTPLLANQLLLIDMGASQYGYCSDMTRTLFLGSPSSKVKRTYRAVLEAQLAGIGAVRPGVKAETVDRATRRVLHAHQLDKAFVHSTGHGLGLEIHEPPRLGKGDAAILRAGMVVTIEPGVYLEDFGGIRIEDTVLVNESGCEVLTPTNKEFLAL